MLFDGREYYLIAILIIAASIIIFMWSFEKRKPQAREVVVLAVMTSLAVAGRVLFFMTPQIKPCVAIIIITGIMLGKEAGFLCGAVTAFVSDFFFGTGPWTPWQMAALGIIGLCSALIFSQKVKVIIERKEIICIYGFLITFIAYGAIMDMATVFMSSEQPTIAAFAATYAGGFVFNVFHGAATFVFLWFLSVPFIKKLTRIKNKYGMYS